VLDAFAGSGALGLEALSRGADSIVFIERSKEACRVIAANISSLILDEAGAERVKLIQADALMPGTIDQLVKGAPFDLVFLDPPYAMKMNRISELLQRLADSGLLAPDCLICYECAQSPSQSSAAANSAATKHGKSNRGDGGAERDSKDPSIVVNGLNMISCKRYGTTNLEYYRLRSPHDLQE
jgi:16S rRNA (guanine966-N2)-methyltransferase